VRPYSRLGWCTVLGGFAALVLSAGGPPAVAQDDKPTPEAWRGTVEAFVADPAVVPTRIWKDSKPQGPNGPDWEPREGEIIYLRVGERGASRSGCVVTTADGTRVIGFDAIFPRGPYPMTEIPREEAEAAARAYGARLLPELTEPGGELEVVADQAISPFGQYLFHLYRRVNGMRVPTRARVGIRVWDGKVAVWRGEPRPLTIEPKATLTLDQAREAAQKRWEGSKNVIRTVVESELTVLDLPGKTQRNCWVLLAEMGISTWKSPRLGMFHRYVVDAVTGELISVDKVEKSPELILRYQAAGGTESRGRPRPFAIDELPVFSPDGQWLYFLSSRPREGYPVWLGETRPRGLFRAKTDGTGLECLVRPSVGEFLLKPDGTSLCYTTYDGSGTPAHLMNLETGETTTLSLGKLGTRLRAWLADGRMIAGARDIHRLEYMVVDPANPEGSRVPIPPCTGPADMEEPFYNEFLQEPSGKVLVSVSVDRASTAERQADRSAIVRIDPNNPAAPPEIVCPYVKYGDFLQFAPDGRLYAEYHSEDGWSKAVVVDLATGAQEELIGPKISSPEIPERYARDVTGMVVYSPDKTRMATLMDFWTDDYTANAKPPQTCLFIGPIAGGEMTPVTRRSFDLCPMWEHAPAE